MKRTIGRKDKIDIPQYSMFHVEVKIDSGAYSCSIHCASISLKKEQNADVLEVVFLDPTHKSYTGESFRFTDFSVKKVKSSTGHEEERFFVKLPILLFDHTYVVDFSLTSRNGLRNPILLGRKLTNNQFLIDTSLVNLSYKETKKKNK